jgi:polysaccharide biosynthesis transport protein
MHRLEVVQPAPPGAFVVYPSAGALPRPPRTRDSQLREMLAVLRRRWRLVAGLAGAGLTLMAVVSLLTPRLWTAKAVLHVNIQPPQVTNLPQVVTPPSYFEGVEFFQDQVKFLESRSLAARVIRELGLDHEPAFTGTEKSGWGVMTAVRAGVGVLLSPFRILWPTRKDAAPEQPRDASEQPQEQVLGGVPSGLIGRYGHWLEVKPITNSRLIEVSFTSPSPGLSQRVANAHARSFIFQSLESKFQLTGEARDFLQKEIARVERELAEAERALSDFRREHAVVSLDDHENATAERLTDLGRRVTDSEAARIAAEAEYRLVQNRASDSLPSVLTNPLIQGLKQEVSKLEVKYAEQAQVFIPSSPQVKEIDAQLKRAQGRLAREVAQAVAGIQSAYLAAQAKEQKLREQFQLQQDAVLNLKDLSGQYIKLDQAVTTSRALHATLLQRLQETDVVKGAQLSNATVVDPAERPLMPSQPDVPFNLTFGLLFGGGLGLALAFARENVDGSLKTPDDVRHDLELPTLGVVPDYERLAGPGHIPALAGLARIPALARLNRIPALAGLARIPALASLGRIPALASLVGSRPPARRRARGRLFELTPTAEAYRGIRTSVLSFNRERPPRTLLVTSSQPREGKTSTTIHLAVAFAQLSRRVIVIDADMRHSRCHRTLGVKPGLGLSDVLRGTVRLPQAIERLAVLNSRVAPPQIGWTGPELHLLQAGRQVRDPSSLLAAPQMDELLQALHEAYDLVLIDSPPVFPITDSAILAPRVDGVVLVVRCHRTTREITREALERLRFMQANVIGVVLNAADPKSSAYQSYSYYFAA